MMDISFAASTEQIPSEEMSEVELVQQGKQTDFVAGDGISIDTFPDTTSFLNTTFPIDGNGNVEFPMIGKLNVTLMTADELSGLLKEQYKNFLRYPTVRVKPMIRISVVGGVARPGLYYIDDDYSLWDVLYQAGGPISEDGLREMRLERDSDIIYDNLLPFFEKGISLKRMHVRSGDQVWIPSPTRPTFWQEAAQVMPFVTFTVSLVMTYLTYQIMITNIQYGRR